MFDKKTPAQKEWEAFLKREKRQLEKFGSRRESFWEKRLASLVPDGLSSKLETAFQRAFEAVLQGGTGLIEKTYSREKLEAERRVRDYKTSLMPTRKHIRENTKTARRQAEIAMAAAGIQGAGLGLLGIGLPDIPLFLAALIRSLYTLCLSYGIDYKKPAEQELLLEMIELSLYQGDDFFSRDAALNRKLYALAVKDAKKAHTEGNGLSVRKKPSSEAVQRASKALSRELLYLKFLQGIPVAGVIGGVYDSIYMGRITKYSALKLERRHLLRIASVHTDAAVKLEEKRKRN
ncbi:MAG: EcsC family protein [Clostridium sp.]|nr:EcsC family protein [Clostridium sp.]